MKRSQKRAIQQFNSERFDIEHAFIPWFAAYFNKGAAKCVSYKRNGDGVSKGCDLMMGDLASRRFSIGIENKRPYLAIDENDIDAVTSFNWSQAAFLRKVQSGDWVVLSCKDSRIQESNSDEAIPLRLWLPCRTGLLDGFLEIQDDLKPKEIGIIESYVTGGQFEVKNMDLIKNLPLVFKGNWAENQAGLR